ncbi:hypothetical protein [Actinoplanes sp. M2I2]|uniref:hypothetical protein n=1 Tax=Actinoplanes sp. M2I2 TaxID=1734444 RepID=UPI002020FE2E|nr:hypothetical protein [Actinoplanes sp. M2I2]
MVDIKARSIFGYGLELLAGLAVVMGILMIISAVLRRDLLWGVIGVVLTAGAVFVFKRPGRARWPR